MARLDEFGKGLQIAVVGFAGERTQPFFHAQIRLVVMQERKVTRTVHTSDYPRLERFSAAGRTIAEPRSPLNQHHQYQDSKE